MKKSKVNGYIVYEGKSQIDGNNIVAIVTKSDTQIIGSTWSNMFGILLTNSFSIVGTILGVKYGTSPNKDDK